MELKDRILLAAYRKFTAKGLREVSMDEIAEEIGISKRTLYENFKSKEALIGDVFGQTFLQAIIHMEEKAEEMKENGYNAVEILLYIYIQHRKATEKFHDAVFAELRKYYPSLSNQYFDALQDRLEGLFKKLYTFCQADGFIRSDINTKLIFLLIKDLTDDKLGYIASGHYTHADIGYYLIRPLVRSIGTPKGLRAFGKAIQNCDDPYSKQLINTLFS